MRGRRAQLHPIFYGSFDWHSCVHGWWKLLTLRAAVPRPARGGARSRELADATLTAEKLAGELAYLDRPIAGGFERPYGWAWLLALQPKRRGIRCGRGASALRPLADAFAARLARYLRELTYPIRTGTHGNTRLRADPVAASGPSVRSGAGRR